MPLYYDVIHVFDTPANLATNLKNGMIGYDVTNDRFAMKRLADGVIKYWENDTDQSYVKTDGTTPITGAQTFNSEIKVLLYAQAAQPTMAADNFMAFWQDTDDSDKIYLLYRKTGGTVVKVLLS